MLIFSFGQQFFIYAFLLIAQSLPAYLLPTSQVTLDIASATWGGSDFTQIFQDRYAAALSQNGGADPSFTFTADNDFFTNDPNVGVHKAAVIVYRAFYGAGQWSNFKTVSVKETDIAILTAPNQADGIWTGPTPGNREQYIISATWYNKDVTPQVQKQFGQTSGAPSVPSSITVSIAALGADPADGTQKQLSVTYANFMNGSWRFRVAVDLNEAGSWTLSIRPAIYYPRDLRLNIISATWGGLDYTDWVREHYISQTLGLFPTDTNNIWSFTASNDFFGPDPAPGYHKTFVVAFRFAYRVGYTTGPLISQTDPPIYSSDWWNNGNPPTVQSVKVYPILEDFTDIQHIVLLEGENLVLSLPGWPKLTTGSWGSEYQAVSAPDNQPPWVALAMYSNIDVTEKVNTILFDQTQRGVKGPLSISVNPGSLGVTDPRPGEHTQLSVFVGWPTPNGRNAYEFRTFSALNGVSDITIPRTPPAPGKQYPEPYQGLTVRKVKFTNAAPTSSYPYVAQSRYSSNWSGAGEQNSGHYHIFFRKSFIFVLPHSSSPLYQLTPIFFHRIRTKRNRRPHQRGPQMQSRRFGQSGLLYRFPGRA